MADPTSPTTAILLRLKASGLTQIEIAQRTGIPQPRISRWLNGSVPSGADDALKLRELESELAAGADQTAAAPATSRARET
jgi:transcriptional regulator with XRE-family HTH domain